MTSVTIDRVLLRQVNLPPKVERTDAIQSFVTQETILLTLVCSDGIQATGLCLHHWHGWQFGGGLA
jgi:hypothetical protein